MIYRIKINGGPAASARTSSGKGGNSQEAASEPSREKTRPDRWFVTQIESRFGQIIHEPLPHDWADLVAAAARLPSDKG